MITSNVKAFAKINLNLRLTGEVIGHLHELDSCMQLIDLNDEIEIKVDNSYENKIKVIGGFGEDDLCFKATQELLKRTTKTAEITIIIEKKIPIGAGLGGGSSDCARVLVELNNALDINLELNELLELGLLLGSDVPFFIFCYVNNLTSAKITGLGEKVCEFNKLDGFLILKTPKIEIPTGKVYAKYDEISFKLSFSHLTRRSLFFNDLEAPAFELYPELKKIKKDLENRFEGNKVLMSGSGSSFFVYFENKVDVDLESDERWLSLK